MKHSFTNTDKERKTTYYWNTGQEWNYLELVTAINPKEPVQVLLNHLPVIITMHIQNKVADKTREFEIEHPAWNIYPGISFDMKLDAATIYGNRFADYFQQPPFTSFLMDGSRTKVSFPVLL